MVSMPVAYQEIINRSASQSLCATIEVGSCEMIRQRVEDQCVVAQIDYTSIAHGPTFIGRYHSEYAVAESLYDEMPGGGKPWAHC